VRFDREIFASAPDDVTDVRLTASRRGQISFEARLQTPQRASVEATPDGDPVMRGVNGNGNWAHFHHATAAEGRAREASPG
jgi:alpha-L-fucosidase 2